MLTEVAFLTHADHTVRHKRPCSAGKQFEVSREMQGLSPNQSEPAALKQAAESCIHCACRKACRHWLRTGVFDYAGDPRCPNAALLHN
jgi:hypothetical protein